MFGPDEYRYFCTELGKVAGRATDLRDRLGTLRSDLHDDLKTQPHESHAALSNASIALAMVLADLDSAVSALPVPTREGR